MSIYYRTPTRKEAATALRKSWIFVVTSHSDRGDPNCTLFHEQLIVAFSMERRRRAGEVDPQPHKWGAHPYNMMATLEAAQRQWRIDRKRKRLVKRWDRMRAVAEKARQEAPV